MDVQAETRLLELTPAETRLIESRLDIGAVMGEEAAGYHLIEKMAPLFLDQVSSEAGFKPIPLCSLHVTEAECWYLASVISSNDSIADARSSQLTNVGIPLLRKIYRALLELRGSDFSSEAVLAEIPREVRRHATERSDQDPDADKDAVPPA